MISLEQLKKCAEGITSHMEHATRVAKIDPILGVCEQMSADAQKTRYWSCWDHDGDRAIYEAETAEDAAKKYVEDGWGQDDEVRMATSWYDIQVIEVGPDGDSLNPDDEGEEITVTLDASAPTCQWFDGECNRSSEHHIWTSPNWTDDDVCSRCGLYRDERHNIPRGGGFNEYMDYSCTYREADDDSLTWIESQSESD